MFRASKESFMPLILLKVFLNYETVSEHVRRILLNFIYEASE
jgi:hypothetical protein